MNLASLPSTVGTETASERASPANTLHLGECVSRVVQRYLSDLGDTPCAVGLHTLILREVEAPLLREVLAWHEGNQSRAAASLGINRATLRKKLLQYGIS